MIWLYVLIYSLYFTTTQRTTHRTHFISLNNKKMTFFIPCHKTRLNHILLIMFTMSLKISSWTRSDTNYWTYDKTIVCSQGISVLIFYIWTLLSLDYTESNHASIVRVLFFVVPWDWCYNVLQWKNKVYSAVCISWVRRHIGRHKYHSWCRIM